MNRGLMVVGLSLLVLSLAAADYNSYFSCSANSQDCSSCQSGSPAVCYCNLQTNTCWVNTTPVGSAPSGQNPASAGGLPLPTSNAASAVAAVEPSLPPAVLLQQALAILQQQVTEMETGTRQQISSLQASLSSLQQQVSQLSLQVQSASLQSDQVGGIRTELGTVSSGLAALQHNLDQTKSDLGSIEKNLKKEQQRTKLLYGVLFSVIVLAAAAAAVYFISHQRKRVNPQLLKYINSHLKQGRTYPEVKAILERAGWNAEEVEQAYHLTAMEISSGSGNSPTSRQKDSATPAPQFNSKKVAGISLVSILILLSVIFLLKGVTTGQAIRFTTEEELGKNVLQQLQEKITDNQFYSLVQSALFCIEVKDGLKSVSFRILKTSLGHSIEPARKSCSDDNLYNAAVKFTSWDNFAHLIDDFTCKTARELHAASGGTRGVYVLPSQLVLSGFKKNPQVDYSLFCPLFRSCLNQVELAVLGC